MASKLPAEHDLEKLGIAYRLFSPSQLPGSLEQAAAERGQRPDQVVRSILFRIAENDFVLVLVAGVGQLSWRKLRAYLGVSRMALASEAEVLEVIGAPRGAVGPFGLPRPIRILADESVFLPEEISIGSGVRGLALILKPSDLRRAIENIESGEFI